MAGAQNLFCVQFKTWFSSLFTVIGTLIKITFELLFHNTREWDGYSYFELPYTPYFQPLKNLVYFSFGFDFL